MAFEGFKLIKYWLNNYSVNFGLRFIEVPDIIHTVHFYCSELNGYPKAYRRIIVGEESMKSEPLFIAPDISSVDEAEGSALLFLEEEYPGINAYEYELRDDQR